MTSLSVGTQFAYHIQIHQYKQGGTTQNNEGAPKSTNYLTEWKVTLNNRILAKDTEQNLVFKPSAYWQQIKEKAERIVQREKSRNQQVRSDDTTVLVAINGHSQRDLTKRFEGTDIDWTPIETQLLRWGHPSRQGKKLRLLLSINYIKDNAPSPSRTDKRGNTSTTNGMLHDLHDQVPLKTRRDSIQSCY